MILDTLQPGITYEINESAMRKYDEFEAVKQWCMENKYTMVYCTSVGAGYVYWLLPPKDKQ